jgi:hypothetical protein
LSSGHERSAVAGVVVPFKLLGCFVTQSGMPIMAVVVVTPRLQDSD